MRIARVRRGPLVRCEAVPLWGEGRERLVRSSKISGAVSVVVVAFVKVGNGMKKLAKFKTKLSQQQAAQSAK